MFRYHLFNKIVLLIVVMLIPVVLLYSYSNKMATDVVVNELNRSSSNQLAFFQSQVNTSIDELSSWPILLIHDPDIESFEDQYLDSEYLNLDLINQVKRIQNKLSIQESSSNWRSNLSLYSPSMKRMITEGNARSYDKSELERANSPGWQVRKVTTGNSERYLFSWYTVSPYSAKDAVKNASSIIKIEFDSTNIQDMLDKFKSNGRRDPFYYKPGTGTIYNRTADLTRSNELLTQLDFTQIKDVDYRTVELGEDVYSVHMVLSPATGWYLIDYIPLTDVLAPIKQSNQLFYGAVACLLFMSFLAAYLLYVQVQIPVRDLMRGFQRLKRGDYTVRLDPKGRNEFSFLSERFNSMVVQIQELFEHVYLEQIQVREARLKQLQSQINPHFFYNCFSFITSMAKLGKMDAVVAMSHNLSRYYRYTTRQEKDLVPMKEEIDFVLSYLKIQKMRMSRLDYVIEIPDEMLEQLVPPLVLQPLIENAVIHGIERSLESGFIRVTGFVEEGMLCLQVEDDGLGLDDEGLDRLRSQLSRPMDEHSGCGLWNVNQRMQLRYGEKSYLSVEKSPMGGFKASIYMDNL
ncbi:sensor histidine kinase [Paenibacillus sp. Marseille-Q4541]|uniref:sensor histidine kinase n=1 Tax=Paenibacillus sp. Marseille-Q4541 TaxID=2831522 RepID=UPI001BAB1792|nr:sensor histidine kinase [Paenibacillus sp. Marseille-Q4541]